MSVPAVFAREVRVRPMPIAAQRCSASSSPPRWVAQRPVALSARDSSGHSTASTRKSLVTVIREMVQEQVQEALHGLLGSTGPKKKPANGRRRRRRRRGPGRPPGSKTEMRRGSGRPPGAKTGMRRRPGRPAKTEQAAPGIRRHRRRRIGQTAGGGSKPEVIGTFSLTRDSRWTQGDA